MSFLRDAEGEFTPSTFVFIMNPSILRIRKHVRNWWTSMFLFSGIPKRVSDPTDQTLSRTPRAQTEIRPLTNVLHLSRGWSLGHR